MTSDILPRTLSDIANRLGVSYDAGEDGLYIHVDSEVVEHDVAVSAAKVADEAEAAGHYGRPGDVSWKQLFLAEARHSAPRH